MSTVSTPVFEPIEIPSKYAKALVAIAIAVVGVLVVAQQDQVVNLSEWLGITAQFLFAVGVYLIPNLPAGLLARYAKMVVAILGTMVQAAIPLIVDGRLTSSSLMLIVLAALNAAAVGITPNVNVMAGLEHQADLDAAQHDPTPGTSN